METGRTIRSTATKTTAPPQPKRNGWLAKIGIMALLEVDEQQYNEAQYNEGLKYLKAYLKTDEYGISVLETSRIFWNWWKNHWANRDEQFLEMHINSALPVEEFRRLYYGWNRGSMLAMNIHPNSVILTESYESMTREIVETETAKV